MKWSYNAVQKKGKALRNMLLVHVPLYKIIENSKPGAAAYGLDYTQLESEYGQYGERGNKNGWDIQCVPYWNL